MKEQNVWCYMTRNEMTKCNARTHQPVRCDLKKLSRHTKSGCYSSCTPLYHSLRAFKEECCKLKADTEMSSPSNQESGIFSMSEDDQTLIFTPAKPNSTVKGKDSLWRQSDIPQWKLKAQWFQKRRVQETLFSNSSVARTQLCTSACGSEVCAFEVHACGYGIHNCRELR